MNRELEAMNNFLAWLLQDPDPTVKVPSGEDSHRGIGPEGLGAADLQFNELDPLDSEEIVALPTDLAGSTHFSFQEIPLFQPGDRPAVQDRFHSLLKRRLRAEIERKPPLFPWESEIYEYDSEAPDFATPGLVPTGLWATQLRNLNLPVPMPEAVLSRLFSQCQELVQSSLQEGVKLVRAVESLFPGHDQTLNQLAGMVLTSPARSPRSLQQPGFPNSYDSANQPQQMVLSLLAAREIIDSLTLSVSPNQPKAERQWITAAGPIVLTAEYPSSTGQLRIQSRLPCSGSLRLEGGEAQASAQRTNSGPVSVELFDVSPNRVYPLEIRLTGSDNLPLVFAVHPTSGSDG